MPTAEKARTIEQAKEWYSKSVGVVFSDYRGLKVKDIQNLRRDLRSKGGELHVLKNTLFRIAAGDDTANMPAELHNGTTAVTFVFENETDVTKSLFDYAKTNKKLVVKGGFFGGRALNAKQVEALASLPPRDILIAQVIGAIAAPLTNLVTVVEALYAEPIRTIAAVADKVAEGSPLPEPSAPEAPATEASSSETSAETPSETAEATAEPTEEPAPNETNSTEAAE